VILDGWSVREGVLGLTISVVVFKLTTGSFLLLAIFVRLLDRSVRLSEPMRDEADAGDSTL
jgi:hypothetical protein